MVGKLYACEEGEAHHLSSGRAVAREHSCADATLPQAITRYLARFPEVWNILPWTCLACNQDNEGTREHCCVGGETGSRAHALDTLLCNIGQELTLMYEVEVESTELVSIRFLIELLFSPHNNRYQGLLKDAFLLPVESDNPCACMSALGLCETPSTNSTAHPLCTSPASATLPPTTNPASSAISPPCTSAPPSDSPTTNPVSLTLDNQGDNMLLDEEHQDPDHLVQDIMAIELDPLSPVPMDVDLSEATNGTITHTDNPEESKNSPTATVEPIMSWAQEMEQQDPTLPPASGPSVPPTPTATLMSDYDSSH